jgi:anhydro-N-acetylmuramic acid kinase
LGYPVAWDFRTYDVAQGGQGAPLAPFYHFALAKWMKAEAPLAFLNLGGVGNITWVDPACDDPADLDALLAFDTGPANAPMNDLMMQRNGVCYDKEGALAAKGKVDAAVLSRFSNHRYFARPAPKSLDRDSPMTYRDCATQTRSPRWPKRLCKASPKQSNNAASRLRSFWSQAEGGTITQ